MLLPWGVLTEPQGRAGRSGYTVVGGETLRDVARNVLGDASLWWRIADANSLAVSADTRLTAGQTLTVPKLALNANNADTFQPYDPSKITGSMDPTLPVPAQGDKCGGMGKIIMAVVAVVVAVYAPQFLGQMGFSGLTTGAAGAGSVTALGGAVGGAAGSIASQAVGNAIGAQDGFSWKGVAMGALSGGISAGLSGSELLGGNSWQMTAARMATANALTQGVAVATGLQKSFDWRGVAASAVGGGVGVAVSGPLTGALGNFGGRLATGLVAGTAAAMARGGKVAIQQVAVDAFGNALGQSLAYGNGQASGAGSGTQENRLGGFIQNNTDRDQNIARMLDLANRPESVGTWAGMGGGGGGGLDEGSRSDSGFGFIDESGARRQGR